MFVSQFFIWQRPPFKKPRKRVFDKVSCSVTWTNHTGIQRLAVESKGYHTVSRLKHLLATIFLLSEPHLIALPDRKKMTTDAVLAASFSIGLLPQSFFSPKITNTAVDQFSIGQKTIIPVWITSQES